MAKSSRDLDALPIVEKVSKVAARSNHKMDRRAHLVPALSALAFALMAPGQGHAEMYRWLDQTGVTVYSQSPPPSGEATEIRKDPAPRASDVEAARTRLKQQLESEFDDREAETERSAKEAEKEESARRDSEACAAARSNLKTIENLGARRAVTPEGDAVYLSDRQRRDLMDKARDQIRKTCR